MNTKSRTMTFDTPVTHAQAALLITTCGATVSVLLKGSPGIGKSSVLSGIAEQFGDKWRRAGDNFADDKYQYIYVDCPMMDFADFGMRVPNHESKSLEFYTSSLFCLTDKRPKVIMLDERFKALKALQPLFTRLDLERTVGDIPLPDGSIVFSTTNLASDGVGDNILAHSVNRQMVATLRSPMMEGWCAWAAAAGISPSLIAAAAMNPRFFESYTDGDSAADNPYIFKPSTVGAFLSPRSLSKCDVVVRNMKMLGEDTTRAALSGLVGVAASERLMAVLNLQHDMADRASVLATPATAAVPKTIGGLYMTIFNVLDAIHTQDEMSAFMEYMGRTNSVEMESVVFTLIMRHKRLAPMGNRNNRIRQWAMNNMDMLATPGAA